MTGIMFAKAHMGEHFRWGECEVRVIGYGATGCGTDVIVDCPTGWSIEYMDSTDMINTGMCSTGRCMYVNWEDLK